MRSGCDACLGLFPIRSHQHEAEFQVGHRRVGVATDVIELNAEAWTSRKAIENKLYCHLFPFDSWVVCSYHLAAKSFVLVSIWDVEVIVRDLEVVRAHCELFFASLIHQGFKYRSEPVHGALEILLIYDMAKFR